MTDFWTMDPNCTMCNGYGGWWSRDLGVAPAWAVHPDTQDDGVGYVVCPCWEEQKRKWQRSAST